MNKKKNLAVKIGVFLAVVVVGFFGAERASAAENDELKFVGIRDTVVEAGTSFSTIKSIDAFRNGKKDGYSVYYRGKKISSSNFINTKKPTVKGKINSSSKYHLLRYNLKSGNKEINVHRKIYIRDTKAPTFSGIKNSTINYGSKFSTIKGITARDSVDGKREYSVYVAKHKKYYKVGKKHFVDTKKSGKWYLKYVCYDKSGNKIVKKRVVTVKPKIVKTKKVVKEKSTQKAFKAVNTVHVYPRRNDERGWWYIGLDQSRLFIHSARGENLAKIKPNTKLIVHVNGTSYEYRVYDRFLMYADRYLYPNTPKGMEHRYSSRGNKSASSAIEGAPLYLQTCWGDDARVLIALAKPVNQNKTLKKVSSVYVSNPQ